MRNMSTLPFILALFALPDLQNAAHRVQRAPLALY
jgi:hypothetical protein